MKLFIDDGFTKDAAIEVEGGELKFSYRPATAREVKNWLWVSERSMSGDADVKFVAEHLVTWNAGVPANADSVGRIQDDKLLTRMIDIITGHDTGDDQKN